MNTDFRRVRRGVRRGFHSFEYSARAAAKAPSAARSWGSSSELELNCSGCGAFGFVWKGMGGMMPSYGIAPRRGLHGLPRDAAATVALIWILQPCLTFSFLTGL